MEVVQFNPPFKLNRSEYNLGVHTPTAVNGVLRNFSGIVGLMRPKTIRCNITPDVRLMARGEYNNHERAVNVRLVSNWPDRVIRPNVVLATLTALSIAGKKTPQTHIEFEYVGEPFENNDGQRKIFDLRSQIWLPNGNEQGASVLFTRVRRASGDSELNTGRVGVVGLASYGDCHSLAISALGIISGQPEGDLTDMYANSVGATPDFLRELVGEACEPNRRKAAHALMNMAVRSRFGELPSAVEPEIK